MKKEISQGMSSRRLDTNSGSYTKLWNIPKLIYYSYPHTFSPDSKVLKNCIVMK